MTRTATRLLALVLVLLTVLPAVPAGAQGGAAVTWTVDHRRQTITVAAKLQIFLGPCAPAPDQGGARGGSGSNNRSRDCEATAARIADDIKRDIESVWNGHTYRCYRLIFRVDVSVTDSRFTVGADRVGVRIDRSVVAIRSYVGFDRSGAGPDSWQGDTPADRPEVANVIAHPSNWAYPPTQVHMYAHEFGHVLGLHDSYVEGSFVTRPGAANDLMVTGGVAFIDQTTIDRVVGRNRDRLVDRQGQRVRLEDLVCDRLFRATLTAHEQHYDATNIRHELTGPGCDPPSIVTETTSTHQTLDVLSRPVDVNVVEDTEVGTPGYSIAPRTDVLRILWGLTGRYRDALATVAALDLPVTVTVDRLHQDPAQGAIPPLEVSVAEGCSENEPGGNRPPSDCGIRRFDTWLAAQQRGGGQVVLGWSELPMYLSSAGRASERLDALYRNCPGPTPWPADFVGGADEVTPGQLPPLDEITAVARDWYHEHRPGRVVLTGSARLDDVEPGRLQYRSLQWTLVLCPVDRAGTTPPGCP